LVFFLNATLLLCLFVRSCEGAEAEIISEDLFTRPSLPFQNLNEFSHNSYKLSNIDMDTFEESSVSDIKNKILDYLAQFDGENFRTSARVLFRKNPQEPFAHFELLYDIRNATEWSCTMRVKKIMIGVFTQLCSHKGECGN